MNKTIKYCVAGTVLYGTLFAVRAAGEGTMLGLLAKYDLKPSEAIEVLKEYQGDGVTNTIRRRFVRLVALMTMKESKWGLFCFSFLEKETRWQRIFTKWLILKSIARHVNIRIWKKNLIRVATVLIMGTTPNRRCQ